MRFEGGRVSWLPFHGFKAKLFTCVILKETFMQACANAPVSASRPDTIASHYRAVERVILAMRERLDEALTLEDLAEVAIISPFYFDRIFRQITGIPPCQFLSALRMEAAKRLLLTSSLSVTDVCFEVGYNSLGTFTTRFTQLVGLPPSH